MNTVIKGAVLGAAALALASTGFASAGKRLVRLDKESETGRDQVGFVIGGTQSPTKKFVVKITSKPKGVSVTSHGQILCARRNGTTAKTRQVVVTRSTPYKFKVKPTFKKNRFCDLTLPVDAPSLDRRTTVTGQVFHKR